MPGIKMSYLLVLIALSLFVYLGWKMTSRSAYESAEYTVLESEGSFEIRIYPDLILVTTPTRIQSQGNDGSFGRLFRYISGDNDTKSKVSMTTPVFMESDKSNATGQMSFVIPKEVAASGTPAPTNERVKLNRRPGGRFAVVRFAGQATDETRTEKIQELRDWMKSRELVGESAPEFAGYDPPWTPGPFRRNEVLIRLN
jgi:DNA gyrase inhibitor GyrI